MDLWGPARSAYYGREGAVRPQPLGRSHSLCVVLPVAKQGEQGCGGRVLEEWRVKAERESGKQLKVLKV